MTTNSTPPLCLYCGGAGCDSSEPTLHVKNAFAAIRGQPQDPSLDGVGYFHAECKALQSRMGARIREYMAAGMTFTEACGQGDLLSPEDRVRWEELLRAAGESQ